MSIMGGEIRKGSAENDPDDWPTPPWASRAGMEFIVNHIYGGDPEPLRGGSCLEPCANRGFLSEPIKPWFGSVETSDLLDYGYPLTCGLRNFVTNPPKERYDWVVTNPPFKHSVDFVRNALDITNEGVAIFIRFAWRAEKNRGRLFREQPPLFYAAYEDRVNMWKSRISPETASAVHSAWVVWKHPLPPPGTLPALTAIESGARKRWERKGEDYPEEQVPTPQTSLFW